MYANVLYYSEHLNTNGSMKTAAQKVRHNYKTGFGIENSPNVLLT